MSEIAQILRQSVSACCYSLSTQLRFAIRVFCHNRTFRIGMRGQEFIISRFKLLVPHILLFAFVIFVLMENSALAENDVLYGITNDGQLITIDTTTGQGVVVRGKLSSQYNNISGLAFYNGYFVASFGFPTQTALVTFGLTTGDDVWLHDMRWGGRGHLQGIALAPTGDLYAALTRHDYAINMTTYSTSAVVGMNCYESSLWSGICNQSNFWDTNVHEIKGQAFVDSNTLYVIGYFMIENTPAYYGTLTKMVLSNGAWNKVDQWLNVVNNANGLALKVGLNETITLYYVSTLPNSSTPALYKYDLPSATQTLIGEVGFAVTGITFGPVLDQIISPKNPEDLYIIGRNAVVDF